MQHKKKKKKKQKKKQMRKNKKKKKKRRKDLNTARTTPSQEVNTSPGARLHFHDGEVTSMPSQVFDL